MGGTMFNTVYAQALFICKKQMCEEGITLRVYTADGAPFWAHDDAVDGADPSAKPHDVIDATFVDDQSCVLIASSPAFLDIAIDKLLCIIVRTFWAFALDINWAKGKTEALLQYRGLKAVEHLDARRNTAGQVEIAIPGETSGRVLHVVTKYQHLGSMSTLCNNNMHDLP